LRGYTYFLVGLIDVLNVNNYGGQPCSEFDGHTPRNFQVAQAKNIDVFC